jgi:autotransporter-associated beta strand protein
MTYFMRTMAGHRIMAGSVGNSFVRNWVWLAGSLLILCFSTSRGWPAEPQVLTGHVPQAVAALSPLRRLEATNVLRLAIGLPLRNQDALTNLLRDLYDSASPNYRHYLTPAEFTDRFGPTAQDYLTLTEYARSNGFQVVNTHPNRMLLDVTGAVPDIERAFHLHLRVYQHPTEAREFYAPDAEPQLDLAVPVLHVSGLNNFQVPRPLCQPTPAATALGIPPPASGSGPSGNYAGGDFRAAYAPGVTNTGAGQAVGLLEFQGYYASDITTYEANYGLPAVPLNNVLLGGLGSITADAGDAECPLDIEMAIAMAPGLSQVIIYCTTRSGNTDDILNRMASDNLCKQLSASWIIGADATGLQIYQQFAAQGQTFFNASGDSDAASVTAPLGDDAPYITTVGGTTLVTTGAGGARVSEATWNRGNGTGSSGGISPTYGIPPWQEGISMDTNQGSAFMRNVPDVAMVAENNWVLYNNGGSGAYGGTSCAAPLWAGFLALVNQKAVANNQPTAGFINPALYAIGRSAAYASDFHDITTGNNTLPSSPDKYFAVPGYDLCTGWGTPSGLNLINALALGPVNPVTMAPTNGLAFAGPVGGPFVPAAGTFTLANIGGTSRQWSLINTSAWYTVSPGSGALAPGATANVTVTIAAAAGTLAAGYYPATLACTNVGTAQVQSHPITLAVGIGLTWDSSAGGGVPQDGSGTWADESSLNGTTNWWNGVEDDGWTNATPGEATFGANSGAAGTVTLGGPVTVAGINFLTPGSGNYIIAGGGYTLTLNGDIVTSDSASISAPVTLGLPGTFSTASGQTLAVSGLISGASGNNLTITGPGTVSLTSPNNTSASAGLAGAVTVNAGTLSLNGGGSLYGTLGNVASITVGSAGTLALFGNNAISGSAGAARNVTLNGGSLTNGGSGNQAIGILTLNGGAVSGIGSGTAGSFNLKGDCLVSANATISAPNITAAPTSSFNVTNGATLTFSGTMIGTGSLNFAGPGTLLITGTNTYTGGTTNLAGTIQLGNGGVGGNLGTGPVVNGGTLQLDRSDSFVWTTPISDPYLSGALVKLDTNTITLQATNAFLAPGVAAQINGGTLQINTPGELISGGQTWIAENAGAAACIINGGTLVNSNWLAVGRNSSAAQGTLTLNTGLILETGNGGSIVMGSLGATGTLTVNGGAISNNTAILLGESSTGKGTLNLNGGLVQATQIARSTSPGLSAILNFDGGILQAVTNQAYFIAIDLANVLAGNAIIDDGGNTIVLSQGLLNGGGGGGLIKNGAGILTLTATNNTYTGPTTVNAGTLRISPDPVLHLSFDNVNGSTVINDGTGGAAMNGTLIGAAAISTNGGRFGNALSLNGTASYVVVSNKVTSLDCNAGGAGWTYALWIKTATAGATCGYQGDGTWTSTAQTTFYLNNNGSSSGGVRAGGVRYGDRWLTGTAALNNSAWHFVAITVNSSTKAIYVDGNVDARTGTTGWVDAGSTTASQFWIGESPDTGDGDVPMNGLIDEVYVFGRALSQAEVQSLMTANQLGNRQELPPATALTLAAGATFDMSRLSQTIGSLAGAAGASVLLGTGTNTSNLALGNATNTTFAGTVSGNGTVTKNGAGTLTLAGPNTFAGATLINAGTLACGQSSNSNLVATLQPLLWFTFSQVGSGVVTNLGTGGSALNGRLTGTASISASGRYGSCLSIPAGSASAAYVLVNNPVVAMTGAKPWTIGMWIKTATAGGVYAYQGSGGWASGNMTFYLNEGSDNGYGAKAGGVSYAQGWEEGTSAINNNAWHFVVMTCNGTTKTMYLDGKVDAITANWGANTGVGSQLWIGGSADTGDEDVGLNGLIDEVYVFNRALSQTEIQNIMANQPVDPVITITGQLPAASPVSLAPGAILDLSGLTQTVAALADLGGGGGLVTNSAGAPAAIVLSSGTAATATFSGAISDASPTNSISVTLAGNGTQILAGTNTYIGATTVAGGSLLVNGSLVLSAVTVNAGTLGGTGVFNGPVTIASGGTLAPGPATLGTLTFNAGLTFASGGTNVMKINRTLPINDQLVVAGALSYGGTLVLTNLAGAFVAGDQFELFNAASYAGSFVSVNPATPGAGLAWNTATLATDGTLRIAAAGPPVIGGVTTAGNTFTLGITGGPPGSPWRALTSTDLTQPLTNWVPVWTNVFDINGNGEFTNTIDPTEPQQFFDIVVP